MAKAKDEEESLLPAQVEEQETTLMSMDDIEDPSLAAAIRLPSFDDTTDKQVLKNVREVFKGFDPETGVTGVQFQDTGALADYTQHTMEDIQNIRKTAEANQLCYKAAAMARFWYLGQTIDKALVNGNYGTSAVTKLATALKKSTPYVYQIRSVATKLTVTDCYLLGIRGLDSTHLRKLAQVKDDAIRRAIIDAFITGYQDTADPHKAEQAKKQLIAAVNRVQSATAIDVTTSDPMNGGSDVKVSIPYSEADKYLTQVGKLVKKLSEEEFAKEACNALDMFYIDDDVPDAQEHMDDIKTRAAEEAKRVALAIANLQDIKASLDSIEGVEVTAKD